MKSRRLLMIPDAFWGPDSGACAARSAAQYWADIGCEVAVLAEGQPESSARPSVTWFQRKPSRLVNHLRGGQALQQFRGVLDRFQPDYVFFLGSAISKPAPFFVECRRRQKPIIALWWTQDFYCSRTYACLGSGPCDLCVRGDFRPALRHRCYYGEPGWGKIVAGILARFALRRSIQLCDVLLGSSQAQLDLYRRYGFRDQPVSICPLFFDTRRIENFESTIGDEFVCYGQARFEKGWHLLAPILRAAPEIRLVLPFYTSAVAERALREFRLGEFAAQGQVRVVKGVGWFSGVGAIVAGARGVIIPSIWPTTTEYTLLESLGLGKPIVAFAVGIHAEAFRSGESGLLAPVGDAAAMAQAVRLLKNDHALGHSLSRGARELFSRLTDPERFKTAFMQALEEAAGAQPGGSRGSPTRLAHAA